MRRAFSLPSNEKAVVVAEDLSERSLPTLASELMAKVDSKIAAEDEKKKAEEETAAQVSHWGAVTVDVNPSSNEQSRLPTE